MENNDMILSINDNSLNEYENGNNKNIKNRTTLESLLSLGMIVISFVFIRLGSIIFINNFTVFFCLGIMAADITYISFKKHKIKTFHIVLFSLILLFNISFFITSSYYVKFFSSLFSVILLFYTVFIVISDRKPFTDTFPKEMVSIIFSLPFKSFGVCGTSVSVLIKRNNTGKQVSYVLLGLATALPITLIIAALLMSADSNFSKVLEAIIPNDMTDIVVIILQLTAAFLMASYLLGHLYSSSENHDIEVTKTRKGFPSAMLYSSVIPVCIMYVIFFFVSLNYFTAALRGVLPDGFSLAEYARKGFFELAAVAAINLCIIISLNTFCQKTDNKKPSGIKFLTVFIIISTLTIIITALSKMILYISEKGLTLLRVYTSLFMVLLFVLFICILIKTFKEKFKMFMVMFSIFTVFLGSMFFVDYFIADYNIKGYINGSISELDTANLRNLSDAAIIAAIKYADNDIVHGKLKYYLEDAYESRYFHDSYNDNLEKYIADKLLAEYMEKENAA